MKKTPAEKEAARQRRIAIWRYNSYYGGIAIARQTMLSLEQHPRSSAETRAQAGKVWTELVKLEIMMQTPAKENDHD